jgi:acyl carrier protein
MPESSAFQAGYAAGFILAILLVVGVIVAGLISIIMAFVRRTTGWIVAAIVFALLGLGGVITGVVVGARGVGKAMADQSKSKRMTSDDNWVSLEIPGSWSTLPELHESASLKVGNKFREEYAVVISDLKSDFEGTLEQFAKLTSAGIRENLGPNAEAGPIENAMAGKFPAKRCRLAGKIGNTRIVYLHCSVETPEGFHQLIMWTLPSKESQAVPVFERVADTFQVLNPPKASAVEKKPRVVPRTGTVEERLRGIFVEQLGVPADKVNPEAQINADLGADELDLVELIMATEEEFEIEIADQDSGKLKTVADLTEYVSAQMKNR